MHEVGLMEEVLRIVDRRIADAGCRRVHRIRLRIGGLSGVVPEALAFAFEALKEGSTVRNALLEMEEVPVHCRCTACGVDFAPADIVYECPACGAVSADIRQGRELEIAELEVS